MPPLLVDLRQSIKYGFFPFVLVFLLAIPAYAENASSSIVLVEAVPESESSVSYRMMYLSPDGKRQELLASLREPVDLIQCSNGTVTYLDRKGNIWDMSLQDTTPDLLARTTFYPWEGTVGKTLLRRKESRFYAVNNSDPRSTEISNNRFQVIEFHFDGRERLIASENGMAYAIHALSQNVLEVVSSNGLFQIDVSSMKTTRIVPFVFEDLSYLALIHGGHSMFSRDGGKLIQIKIGVFGETVFRYRVNSGFGLVQDFDGKEKALLIVVVDPDSGGDQLVEVLGSDTEREIYRGATIGSACYMRNEQAR